MNAEPRFLITIDTEGDNLWSRPTAPTTENARFLPRFQSLCERFGLKPTYLTNYEMANSKEFQRHGKAILKHNTGEIGMHLHAWDMPPNYDLTGKDSYYHPYLFDYPEDIMHQKIDVMTRCLEQTFETKMVSHRAGRWGFSNYYAQVLAELNYKVDCSVTPHVSWARHAGDPTQSGGPDFRYYPNGAYFLDIYNIRQLGRSSLLELPVTIDMPFPRKWLARSCPRFSQIPFVEKINNSILPPRWLRPTGKNIQPMIYLLNAAVSHGRPYVQFMLHSSELMPGGSPTFKDSQSIESLYADLETLFSLASEWMIGCTLSEYYEWHMQTHECLQTKSS